jgi:hypothetical protein
LSGCSSIALAFGTRLNPPLDGVVGFGACFIQLSENCVVPLIGTPKFKTGAGLGVNFDK